MNITYKDSITIYLDIYYLMNFFLDYIAISLTGTIIKKNKNELRYVSSAVVSAFSAAFYTYILLSFNLNESVRGILFIFAGVMTGYIMTVIAYKDLPLRERMTAMITLLVSSYTVAGGINAMLRANNSEGVFIILVAFVTAGMIRVVLWIVRTKNTIEKDIYNVEVTFRNKCVQVKGLLDTGNTLREPFSNRPVCVMEASLCEDCLKENYENNSGVYVIPYSSIGKNKGVLYGIMAEKICLSDSAGNVMNYKDRVIVAVYEGKVSGDNSYQIILHKELLIN